MKRLFTLCAIVIAVAVSSCSQFDDSAIWDKFNEQEQALNDLEKRIAALEELCKQMNTNINALQTLVEALEKRDYITNVSPVRKDGEVIGYTISFASSDTITIYNGKDGNNGTGGYTPQIGIKKDADGLYYWTLDGEWLLDDNGNKIKAVGEDGRDGQDGTDGTNGSNGSNGQDGQDGEDGTDGRDGVDGITPRLKIENDYWYVSYDEGATWIELGRATGEDGVDGSDGSDGADGDNMLDGIFTSITQDDEYVYFNLADGTMITLPKHDKENIQFEDLQVKAICCKNWDTNNDGELSYSEAAAVTDIGLAFSGNSNIIAFTEFKYFTGVTSLSDRAFFQCENLWKITLPQNIAQIENGSIDGSSTNGFDGYGTFSETAITCIILPKALKSIGNGAFARCYNLRSIEINDMLNEIGRYAFYHCTALTNLTIDKNVISIGKHAFAKCSSLTNVIIGDSVISIDAYAFYSCGQLASVTIGNGVTSIGAFAFYNNSSISIYCKPLTPPTLSQESFNSKSGMKIFVPRDSHSLYVTEWKDYKSYIEPYDF